MEEQEAMFDPNKWTREMDRALLFAYNEAGFDRRV